MKAKTILLVLVLVALLPACGHQAVQATKVQALCSAAESTALASIRSQTPVDFSAYMLGEYAWDARNLNLQGLDAELAAFDSDSATLLQAKAVFANLLAQHDDEYRVSQRVKALDQLEASVCP